MVNVLAASKPFGPGEVIDDVVTIKGFNAIFSNVVSLVLGFAGIALFIMLLVGGFKYMSAGGDKAQVESAQKTLTYAIGGLVLVVLAFLILRFIAEFTGFDITTFDIYQGT